jgi:hemolysin III
MRNSSEEKWNSITHAIGIGVCLAMLWDGSIITRALSAVLLLTYSFSVLYHAAEKESIKDVMRMLDIISIQLSIYGTSILYAILMGGGFWSCLLLAFLGTVSVQYIVASYGKESFEKYLVPLCVLSGAACLTVILSLVEKNTGTLLYYFLVGCAAYLVGLAFYVKDNEKEWYHTIWHIFVLIGSSIHIVGTI